jgi:hypothetical protein
MDILKKLSFTILLVISCLLTRAQEEFIEPPTRKITSFPFRLLTGGVILLKAQLDQHKDSLNFIFDTGSGGISLDSATADYLKVSSVLTDKTIRGIAGLKKVNFAYHHQLRLPGLVVDSLNFHINDYDVLSSSYGERIDGIIGYAFLSKYIVHIDYDSLRINVFSKGTLKYPRGGFMIRPQLAYIPVISSTIIDEKMMGSKFYFDTGAGMCLLLSKDFVEDSSFLKKKTRWYATQAEGLGGKAPMKMGVIKQMRLGPYKFRKVPTYVFEDVYNVTSYPYLAGLIGNDLLRRFNCWLNYEKRELYLIPNKHLYDPFDYSYTGLGIYMENEEIVVEDVMPGSPAKQAGFEVGDMILSVANNFTGNIQTYKTLLQAAGQKVKVLLIRKGELMELIVKVGDVRKRR